MGLDITVHKLIKNEQKDDSRHVIVSKEELEKLKQYGLDKYIQKKKVKYMNLKKGLQEMGYKPKNMIYRSACYGCRDKTKPECYYEYYDKTHPLLKIFKRLNKKYGTKHYYEIEFEKPFTIKQLLTKREIELLKQYGFTDYTFACSKETVKDGKVVYTLGGLFYDIEDSLSIYLDIDNVPTYNKVHQCYFWREVGYQRKGFNSKFYEDYTNGKIGYFVYSLEELKRYKEDYCEDDMKENFQKRVIDNFVEGECVVSFDW